jgi:hypothetical protein
MVSNSARLAAVAGFTLQRENADLKLKSTLFVVSQQQVLKKSTIKM